MTHRHTTAANKFESFFILMRGNPVFVSTYFFSLQSIKAFAEAAWGHTLFSNTLITLFLFCLSKNMHRVDMESEEIANKVRHVLF